MAKPGVSELNPRSRPRLWFHDPRPRFEVMLEGAADLVECRARNRACQDEQRNDRKRKATRRSSNDGLTVVERDRRRATAAERAARRALERGAVEALSRRHVELRVPTPVDVDAEVERLADRLQSVVPPIGLVAGRAWRIALRMLEPADWEPGKFVLSEEGMARLASTATRAAHMMLAACGVAAPRAPHRAVPDGEWLVAWRVVLADHELGMVIAAVDDLDGGRRRSALYMDTVDAKPALPSLREHPKLRQALQRHFQPDHVPNHALPDHRAPYARVAQKRWQLLRRAGWRVVDWNEIPKSAGETHVMTPG